MTWTLIIQAFAKMRHTINVFWLMEQDELQPFAEERCSSPMGTYTTASHPQARCLHGAVVLDQKKYVVGGRCEDKYLSDALQVYEFEAMMLVSPCNNDWRLERVVTRLPYSGEDFHGRTLDDVYTFDLETKVWERGSTSGMRPPGFCFHGDASINGNYLYLFSGCDNKLYMLDLKTVSETRFLLKAQELIVAVAQKRWSSAPMEFPAAPTSIAWLLDLGKNATSLVGVSLVHAKIKDYACLIASGGDHGQLSVFKLDTMKSYPATPSKADLPSYCRVRDRDDSVVGTVSVSEGGKPVADVAGAIELLTGQAGLLQRNGVALTRGDLVYPGEELEFYEVLKPGNMDLHRMNLAACKHFLSRINIKVMRGEGWLVPLMEFDAEPFVWTWNVSRDAAMNYLWRHGVPRYSMLRVHYVVNSDREHEIEKTAQFCINKATVPPIFLEIDYSKTQDLEKCCVDVHNPEYTRKGMDGLINSFELVIVKKGTLARLMEEAVRNGTSPAQFKTPRCVASSRTSEALNS
ncbi:hypothetical protein SELMODRAFT_421384 [Selaginella moellendorffii]|uniref:GH3 C-terminal domain-containing protein n=1 Tax=Selaginella moellendorffii TaxID=88036 RepID=D8SF38_SELML|nr:hypothetical protein SELMODRAFT_421384 [Selaginella moellendorffii]